MSLNEATLTPLDIVESASPECRPGIYLALEVSDTGCGMTEDVMERMFDPYFFTKEEGKGTGLGLATVYGIVKSCKGILRVKNQVDKGTTFVVFLPVIRAEDTAENGETLRQAQKTGSGERLLVVDDDKDIELMCKEGFEALGYKVDLFFSSMEALDFFKREGHHIDFVVTDQTMPGKTGFDLAKEMLSIRKDIPIILCSGYTGAVSKVKIEEAGIKSFVMKPVTVEDLSKKIQQLLK